MKRTWARNEPGPIDQFLLDRRDRWEIVLVDGVDGFGAFVEYGVQPLVLDRHEQTGRWFVVGTISHPYQWQHSFKPSGMYVELQFDGTRWIPQEVSSDSWWRLTNLLISPPPKEHSGIVRVDEKMRLNTLRTVPLILIQIRPDFNRGISPDFSPNLLVPEKGI